MISVSLEALFRVYGCQLRGPRVSLAAPSLASASFPVTVSGFSVSPTESAVALRWASPPSFFDRLGARESHYTPFRWALRERASA
jgi:hypothetical protein